MSPSQKSYDGSAKALPVAKDHAATHHKIGLWFA